MADRFVRYRGQMYRVSDRSSRLGSIGQSNTGMPGSNRLAQQASPQGPMSLQDRFRRTSPVQQPTVQAPTEQLRPQTLQERFANRTQQQQAPQGTPLTMQERFANIAQQQQQTTPLTMQERFANTAGAPQQPTPAPQVAPQQEAQPQSFWTKPFLSESKGTGLVSALWNEAAVPMSSPAGIGMVGGLMTLPFTGIPASVIGGIGLGVGAIFGGKAIKDIPGQWREYKETVASGASEKEINKELADVIIRGAEGIGAVVAPFTAGRMAARTVARRQSKRFMEAAEEAAKKSGKSVQEEYRAIAMGNDNDLQKAMNTKDTSVKVEAIQNAANDLDTSMYGVAGDKHLTVATDIVARSLYNTKSAWRKIKEAFIQSGRESLVRMGEGGKDLGITLSASVHEGKRLNQKWNTQAMTAIKGLNKKQKAQIADSIEGGIGNAYRISRKTREKVSTGNKSSGDQKLDNAVDSLRDLFDDIGREAKDAGVMLSTGKRKSGDRPRMESGEEYAEDTLNYRNWEHGLDPFEIISNYWPRIASWGRIGPPSEKKIFQQLIAAGETNANKAAIEAKYLASKGAEFRTPQFQRGAGEVVLKDYRKDMGVLGEHIKDMSTMVAQARHLDPIPLTDTRSRLWQAIQKSEDPVLAERVVRTQLQRLSREDDLTRVIGAATNFQMMTKLSYHYISNFAANAQTVLRSEGNAVGRALLNKFGARNVGTGRSYKQIGEDAGATGEMLGSYLEIADEHQKGASIISKMFMIGRGEARERTFSSNVGQASAQTLFKRLKRGAGFRPSGTNRQQRIMKEKLQDLVLVRDTKFVDDAARKRGEIGWDEFMQQDKLTDDQLNQAAGRFSEMVQGLSEGRNLPPRWTESQWLQIPLQFKKFAFQGTKTIKDSLKEHPVRNTLMLGVVSQVFGYGVGTTKAGITGVVRGTAEAIIEDKDLFKQIEKGFLKEQEYRVSLENPFLGESEIVNHIVANLVDSWSAGLMADIFMALMRGEEGVTSFLLGPTAEDARLGIDTIWGAAYGANQMIPGREPEKESLYGGGEPSFGYMKPGARQLLRYIPFIGRGLQRAVMPTERQAYAKPFKMG